MEYFQMKIDSLSKNEEFARVVVAVFMSRLNPTLEEIDDVKTAVSEAVTNAVIHGYQGKSGVIELEVRAESDDTEAVRMGTEGAEVNDGRPCRSLTVIVRDSGIGIRDVKRAMEPMYTTDQTGMRSGMGFSFMEAFMDEVQVKSVLGKGTTVIMKKMIGG